MHLKKTLGSVVLFVIMQCNMTNCVEIFFRQAVNKKKNELGVGDNTKISTNTDAQSHLQTWSYDRYHR